MLTRLLTALILSRSRRPFGAAIASEMPSQLTPRTAALLAGALAVLVYANSLSNGFAYDDSHIITENTELQRLATLPGAMFEPYWHGHDGEVALGLWRPTTTLLLGLEYAAVGESPGLYHAVNVLGHGLGSALVVLLLAQLMTLPIAFAAGLLFAVHPVHVEAVANVVGVSEIMATSLVLLAVLIHLRGASTWARSFAVAALYMLAFGSKESAVTLPGVIFLVDAARRDVTFSGLSGYVRERWRLYVALGAAAAVLLVARWMILGSVANPEVALGGGLLRQIPRIWTLAEVWSHYVRLMVFPLDLASDYSPGVIPISTGLHLLNGVGLVLAIVALGAAFFCWRRAALGPESESPRVVGLGIVWFVITISPVSNVFFLSGVMLAERTLYLPSVGAAMALAWLAAALMRRNRALGVSVLVLTVTLMAARSWVRTPSWKDDGAMFETLVADYPHSGRSQWLMGDIYMTQGRTSEALSAYRAAIPNLGASYGLTAQIGRKLMGAGNLRGAEHLLRQVWMEQPDFATAPALLGVIYSRMGEPVSAEEALKAAIVLQPDNRISHHLLASALGAQERWAEAALARRQVIEMGEDVWQQWAWLAELEIRAGNAEAGASAFDSARARTGTPDELAQIDSMAAVVTGSSGGR